MSALAQNRAPREFVAVGAEAAPGWRRRSQQQHQLVLTLLGREPGRCKCRTRLEESHSKRCMFAVRSEVFSTLRSAQRMLCKDF